MNTESGKWIFKGADEMDEKLVNGITDMIERACNMREIDKIHGHLEHLLYEASGMADYYENVMENYGGTD